jgi:hypothetical protein
MNNLVVQSLWIGNDLSNNERMCLNSYLRHGQHFHLYAYNKINGVPPGITVLDANEILPASCLFKDSSYSYASFADWFRLKMLFLKGGWWVDMDTICIKRFDIRTEYAFSSERHYNLTKEEINNTYIKAPAGDQYIAHLLQTVEDRLQRQEPVLWGELGVYLLRKTMAENSAISRYVHPPDVFCPLDYFNLSALICPNPYQPGPSTLAIHLWNEIWRRGNLDKNATYHPHSPYEALKEKYLSIP